MEINHPPQPTQMAGLDPWAAHEMRSLINSLSLALDVLETNASQHRERALMVARRSTLDLSELVDRCSGTTRHAGSKLLEPTAELRRGIRVLIVEDEYFLARTLADQLTQAGCEVVGPAGSIDDALKLVLSCPCDCAVVDANLDGEFSTPIVNALAKKGIPAIALTGYDKTALPDCFEQLPFIQKPVFFEQLLAVVAVKSGRRTT